MRLLVSVNTKELSKYLKFTNSFIIGLKDYSINYFEITIDEIKELLDKYHDIELFISMNKNIFNRDLEVLENNLKVLAKLPIKGILFYDLSILSIVKRLNLNLNLVFHQTHMATNYNICSFYEELGCKYAYLSSEITADEMFEISNNTNIELMAYFIGHQIISHSKRKLVSNFYEYINKDNDKKLNIIKEKNKDNKYYILENKNGTDILTYDILNGTKAFIRLNESLEYGILDNRFIDDKIFLKVLNEYHDYLNKKIDDETFVLKIEKLIGNYDGFFYKKTIYKVK